MHNQLAPSLAQATDLAERLSRCYAGLMHGLTWIGSEADEPFHPFNAACAPQQTITPDSFRAAAAIARAWQIQINPADDWFIRTIQLFHDHQYGSDDDHALELVYTHLWAAMKTTLIGPLLLASVHFAPNDGGSAFHKARYYLFGQVAGGGLSGLMAHSVET